ncbi:unnamed protein product [Moneuplotes crassus]|uniref:Uncharacterized protein n=1 Tax=Euplotes crassus TaxID=5936 RepID=A0AAD1X950_EUPCR|nr:unnamed protein product [Moneuplotes crassus]
MRIEEEKGQQFMKKLKQFKKKNKESKKRTKINTHKIDWVKKYQEYQKQERRYEDEITEFINQKTAKKKPSKLFVHIRSDEYDNTVHRSEFRENLNYPINGVRQLITSLYEQKKRINFEKKLSKKENLCAEFDIKKIETQELISSVKSSFQNVEKGLKEEYSNLLKEINQHKIELTDVIGFSDQVKGFDIEFMVDDNIEFLDRYANFLGSDYEKMKKDYQKAIDIMNETYQLKFERLKINEPISQEEINEIFSEQEKERMIRIYNDYILGGQNRKKYQERIEIEFPNYPREKLEMLDAYIEHKRWLKVQNKALYRDWEREKMELKQRTIKSIEEEIAETEEKIARELQRMKQESKVAKLHKNRDDMRLEFEAKLAFIKEIEEEKKIEEQLALEKQEKEYQEHCKEIKEVAVNYKQEKKEMAEIEIEKYRKEAKEQEELLKAQLAENKPKVEDIRKREEQKVIDKYAILEEKRNYLQNREERINRAVEDYSFRPQVRMDRDRVQQDTEKNLISKGVIMDKADKVELFKNPGFTVENLMKDIRYKVGAALSNAGLSTTGYAKQLMSGLQGNLAQRKDMNGNNF